MFESAKGGRAKSSWQQAAEHPEVSKLGELGDAMAREVLPDEDFADWGHPRGSRDE